MRALLLRRLAYFEGELQKALDQRKTESVVKAITLSMFELQIALETVGVE